MNSEGYNAINKALKHLQAVAGPKPKAGEDLEYVTVVTDPNVAPANILNALGKVGLMRNPDQTEEEGWPESPKLEPVFGQPGSITLRDTNYGY